MCKVSREAGKSRGSKKEKIDDLDLSAVESNSDFDEDDELEGNIQQLSTENDSKEESFFTTVEQFPEASPESRELMIKKKFSKFDSTSILNEFIDGYKIAKAEGNTSDSDVWTTCLGALIKSEVDNGKVKKRIQIIENSSDQVFRQLAFASIIDCSPELGDVEASVDPIYAGKGNINVSDALRTVAKTSCSLKIIINRVAKAWIRSVLYEEGVPLYTTSINPHGYHTLPADRIKPVKKWLVSTISVAPTEDRIDPNRLPFVIGDAFEKQLNYIFHQSRATKKKEAKRHPAQPSTSSTASNDHVNYFYASDPYERNGS